MTDRLIFRIYGEMYLINPATVLYLKADDHYTHVYSTTGIHMVMPFGLSKVEAAIAHYAGQDSPLLRLGRTYMVNMKRVHHVNALKQCILLADDHGQVHTLHLSKQVLHALMALMASNSQTTTPDT